MEVEVELGVVLLDDDPGGLLDRLGADATHGGGGQGGEDVQELRHSSGKGRKRENERRC